MITAPPARFYSIRELARQIAYTMEGAAGSETCARGVSRAAAQLAARAMREPVTVEGRGDFSGTTLSVGKWTGSDFKVAFTFRPALPVA
jgi:hypothetical protein